MKNTLLKFYVLAFLLAGNFVMFAQPTEETPESEDPEVSINTRLIILAVAGISFAIFYFSQKRQRQLN